MVPAKLNVFFAFYPYGSNGGTSAEAPTVRHWFADALMAAKADERIAEVFTKDFSDTPIPMTRNASVLDARRAGADVLVMCDSDMKPDLYPGKKFFESSFDFLYAERMKNRPCVVAAPYCGPPPNEAVYVFKWAQSQSDNPGVDGVRLEMVSREEAAGMAGIHPAAALPTGLIMFDMQVFDVTDPLHEYTRLLSEGKDQRTAKALTNSWFYYEWEDIYAAAKGSTEDVTCTRDMGLLCREKLGHWPLWCNWDVWAGHWKPKCVGKPQVLTGDQINEKYRQAVLGGKRSDEKLVHHRRTIPMPNGAPR
jgi:hypothetical protein